MANQTPVPDITRLPIGRNVALLSAERRFGFRPSLALRLPRAHADLRAAR